MHRLGTIHTYTDYRRTRHCSARPYTFGWASHT